MKKSVEQEDANSQFNVALLYERGDGGIIQNLEEAFNWYTKSTEQNYADAQFDLGTMYYRGGGVKANTEQADYWTKRSHENCYKPAKDFLEEERYYMQIKNTVFDDMTKRQIA